MSFSSGCAYKSYFYKIYVLFFGASSYFICTFLNMKTGVKAHMFAERRLRGLLAPACGPQPRGRASSTGAFEMPVPECLTVYGFICTRLLDGHKVKEVFESNESNEYLKRCTPWLFIRWGARGKIKCYYRGSKW